MEIAPPPQISNTSAKSASPVSEKAQEYRTNEEAIKKLEKLATSLIDCIVPVIVLTTLSGAIWYLHRHNDGIGLVTGAAASARVLVLIKADVTASQPLIITAAAVYLGFHIAYCKTVTKGLSHADGFVAVTIITATVMLTIFAHLPSTPTCRKRAAGRPCCGPSSHCTSVPCSSVPWPYELQEGSPSKAADCRPVISKDGKVPVSLCILGKQGVVGIMESPFDCPPLGGYSLIAENCLLKRRTSAFAINSLPEKSVADYTHAHSP